MAPKSEKIIHLQKIIRERALFENDGRKGVIFHNDPSQKWIFNIRQICLDADFLNLVVEIFWDIFDEKYPFQVGGQELTAVPLVAAIALHGSRKGKPINGFVIRKSRKTSRGSKIIEGDLNSEKIILIDDAVSTGQTMMYGVKVINKIGKKVETVFSLLECAGGMSLKTFQKYGLDFKYLLNLEDFDLAMPEIESIKSDFREIWHFASPDPNYSHPIPKSAPVIDETNIYFGSDSGIFWALAQNDGAALWKFKVGYPVNGKSIFSTPAIDNTKVYFGSYDGNVYALDKSSGSLIWKFSDADFIGSSPAISLDLGFLFIGLEFGLFRKQGGIAAIRTDTGKKVWDFRMPEYVHGSPAYCPEKRVVAIGGNDHCAYLFDAKKGKLKWKFKTEGEIKASFEFDAKRNLVLFGSFDNNLYAVDIDSGELRGKFETKDYIYSTPKIHRGDVYFTSTDKNLYSVNLDSGKLNWQFTAGGRIFSSPEIINDKILFGANDGILYAVDCERGKCESFFQTTERITNRIAYNSKTKRYFVPTYANEIYCLEK